jgi:hypothetical protein
MRRDTNTLRPPRGPLTADVVLANQDADKGDGSDCGASSAQAASLLPAHPSADVGTRVTEAASNSLGAAEVAQV